MEKLKKISFLLATVFIVAALAVKMVKGADWQLYSNISAGIGVLFFLASLYFERGELKSFFSARSTRHGANAVLMVLFLLAILIMVNWIASRHPMKIDTTANKQFTLSPLTLDALKNLKKPVKITAFFTTRDEAGRGKMQDLLDDYKDRSKMVQVRMVDPNQDPRLTQEYGIRSDGTTVFECGKQRTTISTSGEEDVTNAILKVTSDKQMTVYFLQGHGEPSITDSDTPGLSVVSEELRKANYDVEELKNFAAEPKVPEKASVVVIVAPTAALLDHELKALKEYLSSGGRVLVLDDPQSDASLSKLLADFKITAGDDIVVDDHYFFPLADVAVPLVVPEEGTPLTREFNLQMFFPLCRSLSYRESQEGDEISYTPFVKSTEYSWAETDKKTAEFEEGKDKKGPITIALAATEPSADKKRSPETRLVVFGDSRFIENSTVGVAIPGNLRIFMNSVAWLTEQENLIHLPPRNEKADVMTLSSTQLNYLALLLIVVVPLAVLFAGVFVWRKRKRL